MAGARNLTDLPPAAAVRAVYRRVDGCAAPVVLKRGLGANPHLALPIEGEARAHLLDR